VVAGHANRCAAQGRQIYQTVLPSLQALVVVPSRELGMQIVRVAQSLLPEASRAAVQQCIGGANPHRQVRRTPPLPY